METVNNRIERFKSLYKTAFGVRKYENVYQKIYNSNKITKLLSSAADKHLAPHSLDYLYALNEIPYFIFSKGDTQALGAIIAFERWMRSENNEVRHITGIELNQILDGIINESSKSMLTIRV